MQILTAHLVRRRKLTDKSMPNVLAQLPEFAQESTMYQSLLEMEKKLDWTMTRKRVEVQDALARNPTVRFVTWRADWFAHVRSCVDDADAESVCQSHRLQPAVAGR